MTSETANTIEQLFNGEGFTRMEALITADTADRVRARILDRLEDGNKVNEGVVRVGNLLDDAGDFENLVTHPRLLAVAHVLLGKDATLGAFSGRVLMPGCELGGLHIDYPNWAMKPGMPAKPALMLQVIWMMEPFTEQNGGTWVSPGSQQWSGAPDVTRFEAEASQATGQAGDAIVSHGLLWHRTARNHSQRPRVALLINYTQLTIRPMAPLGPFSETFKEQASPALRALLGFDHGKALQRRMAREKGQVELSETDNST